MDVRPIRNDEDHLEALKAIDRLWGAPAGSPEGDRMEVLVELVGAYERRIYPAPPSDPVGVLRFMMEQNDRSQADLGRLLGSRSRASEILRGKRGLTLDQIRLLSREWRIPAGALVGEPERV